LIGSTEVRNSFVAWRGTTPLWSPLDCRPECYSTPPGGKANRGHEAINPHGTYFASDALFLHIVAARIGLYRRERTILCRCDRFDRSAKMLSFYAWVRPKCETILSHGGDTDRIVPP
jgi:hypothetical protein